MRRLHLFEIHDWHRCPKSIRDGLTNFLELSTEFFDNYGPIRSLLFETLARTGVDKVVDLCSGAGGPWAQWTSQGLCRCRVTLTDKHPNLAACKRIGGLGLEQLSYVPEAVDATAVPAALSGFRTIFTAFHHFRPDQARAVIADAVAKRQPIGIFEFTSRTAKTSLAMLSSPLGVWLLTPRRHTSWQVLVFTYMIPVIPVIVAIDGIVSCLRTYTVDELRSMATAPDYEWHTGLEKGHNSSVTYLIGIPKEFTNTARSD
jgi:hypothetical protein